MTNDWVLSLDPGSQRSGWCLMDEGERLLQAGLLLPEKASAEAAVRIADQCRDLRSLLDELHPGAVVIEWTSGHVGRKRHHGQGAGLAIYGIAVGALWQVCRTWARNEVLVQLVFENEWTAGRTKAERQGVIAALYPEYKPDRDPGGDISDAIGLALWFQREKKYN